MYSAECIMTCKMHPWCFKVRLHTAINRVDFVTWWMWFNRLTTKLQRHFLTECILLPLYVYNMHQDTKSARLIAVCKRSFRVTWYTSSLKVWRSRQTIVMIHQRLLWAPDLKTHELQWDLKYIHSCQKWFACIMASWHGPFLLYRAQ